MSKYIDVKCTVWGRYKFDDDTDLLPIIKKLEEEGHPDVICDFEGYQEYESMIETEEFITPSENGGYSTIEVYQNVNETENWQECIWDNVNKFKQ